MFVGCFRIFTLVNIISMEISGGQVTKYKLCVQIELSDYRSVNVVIEKLTIIDKCECIFECVRNVTCRAINFNTTDESCELLDAGDTNCMLENVSPGVQFIKLATCNFHLPVHAWRPEDHGWRWDMDPPTMENVVTVRSPRGAWRRVGRLLHQGMYLPGYMRANTAYTGLPDGSEVKCSRSQFQHLIFDSSVGYKWLSFYAGEPIPLNSIIGGYWHNHTALYIVYVTVSDANRRIPAYYVADTQRVYPTLDIRSPEMQILIFAP